MPGRWIEAGRAQVLTATAGKQAMPINRMAEDSGRAQRFRDAALPYLDDAYTLARYLLRNADDPTKFIQVIEYETPESFELNRQSLASDARFQAYLQMWRAMLPGALEVDVYQEI